MDTRGNRTAGINETGGVGAGAFDQAEITVELKSAGAGVVACAYSDGEDAGAGVIQISPLGMDLNYKSTLQVYCWNM